VGRRDELLEAATDYVLEHGLVGLSLRPLAEALGTSDRMLLYHFGSKDDLVTAIMQTSHLRSLAHIGALPADGGVKEGVLALWEAVSSSTIAPCCRIYVEASALGLLGSEPYAATVKALNAEWMQALADHLAASGVVAERAAGVARVVDATFMGLVLDQPVEGADEQQRAVDDLAEAVARIEGQGRA
jgi:AcrR family transcriptional regulator